MAFGIHLVSFFIPALLGTWLAGLPARAEKAAGQPTLSLAAHLERLKARVPHGFTVVVQAPFVLIGDEAPATVRQRAAGTVKWAVDQLKQEYFRKDPAEIIDIWLFRDQTS